MTKQLACLWEIFIPTTMKHPSGSDLTVSVAHHLAWDTKVSAICKGLTLLPRVRGKWLNEEERSIPVRIVCSSYEIERIAEITGEHYQQDAVLYWMVSDKAVILQMGDG